MRIIYLYKTEREYGTLYVADYPEGATRFYSSEAEREERVSAYVEAIEEAGGFCMVTDSTERGILA